MQDWLGNTKITPDALGRAQKVQYPDGREVSYTYGKAGERRSMTYPDGKTVFYGYDEQLRLSELKEGDSIINYGYDPLGRLCEKQFPNGTKTTYAYDRKDQLTELVHRDQERILDRYTYLYDLLGNKTGITKERRGLEQESGSYTYGYDALGRLSEIQKDGQMQTRYGYDAFGNRTWKEESGERISYQYNVINQMVSEKHGEILKAYRYDKRGNLTGILENGAWKKQYVYGAINRLEEAVDAAGKQARYQYNGLGHRVGKQEGILSKEKLEKLDPQSRIGMEIGNSRQITYTLDLTRQYYNLLERIEESRSQRYFWDGNVAAYEENGERNYYLQDELGSPLRIEDSAGIFKESYGYGAFGEDLYQNQGKIQPFGYTGYQRDETAGTYYAQAREYLAENGRFAGQDLIAGFMDRPQTINKYEYCINNPFLYFDPTGCNEECSTDNDILKIVEDTLNGNMYGTIVDGTDITFTAIGSSLMGAIKNSPRPNNIGVGVWNRQISSQLDDAVKMFGSTKNDIKLGYSTVEKTGILNKGTKAFSYLGVAIDTIGGVKENIDKKSSWQKIASDAAVDVVVSGGSMLVAGAFAKLGFALGSSVPVIGNVVGAAFGFVAGMGLYALTDAFIYKGKTMRDTLKDKVSSFFKW